MDIIKWLGITDRHKKMYLNKRLAPFGLSSQHLYLLKVCRKLGNYSGPVSGEFLSESQ